MKEFQVRSRPLSWLYTLPLKVFLLVLSVFLVSSAYRLYEKRRLVETERRLLLEEVERLSARQAELADEVAELETERGVEKAIRENFNVVRPGEKVVTFLPQTAATATSSVAVPWRRRFLDWWKEWDFGL